MFAEKPVSLSSPGDVTLYAQSLAKALEASSHDDGKRRVVSVGYMFRHSKAAAKARELIDSDGNGRVMAVLARYNSACTSTLAAALPVVVVC